MAYDRPMRTNPDGSITEIPPARCSNGHPFRPGRVNLGWLACSCVKGSAGHRTYRCAECEVVDYVPAHDETRRYESGSAYFGGTSSYLSSRAIRSDRTS